MTSVMGSSLEPIGRAPEHNFDCGVSILVLRLRILGVSADDNIYKILTPFMVD
jgi:hypothetical protein